MKLQIAPSLFQMIASLLILFLGSSRLSAQDPGVFDEETSRGYKALTSAFVTLASDDSISGGSLTFKNTDEPDADLDIYKFVGEFALTDRDRTFVPLLEITPAYLDLTQEFPNQTSVEISGQAFGLGAGLQINLLDNRFQIIPRMKVDYSKFNYDISIAGIDDNLVDSIIPDVDTWTYIPSLELLQRIDLGEQQKSSLILNSQISLVYVDASTSSRAVDDFSEQSWVWKNSVAFEDLFTPHESLGTLVFRPELTRVDNHGSSRDGLGFNNFYEFQVRVLSREVLTSVFQELGFGASYLYEKEIQGWRFGIVGRLS